MDKKSTKNESNLIDKDPVNRRDEKVAKKAFKSTEKSIMPVAKDTNKTRRKTTKARTTGPIVPNAKPRTNLKKDMKKSIRGMY